MHSIYRTIRMVAIACFATLPIVLAGCGSYGGGGGGSTTVPAAPAGLMATAGNTQVALAWTPSTGATLYYVKRSTISGSGYTQIAAPTAPNYMDMGLTNGTAYFYVVTALNSAGESSNSSQATATPANAVADVTITIDPAKIKSISPYIYGINC